MRFSGTQFNYKLPGNVLLVVVAALFAFSGFIVWAFSLGENVFKETLASSK